MTSNRLWSCCGVRWGSDDAQDACLSGECDVRPEKRNGAGVTSRIALGTAQFGLDYGVANKRGRIDPAEGREMLALARACGVDTLDTAIAYGESEARLGALGVEGFKVVSKIPGVPVSCERVENWVVDSVRASLQRLKIGRLYAVLVHRPLELLGPNGDALWRGLEALKSSGAVEKVGISVYGPQDIDALAGRCEFDLIQAPLSVCDRRLPRSGWLSRLHDRRVEIHARSAFLQGLLLMRAEERPKQFDRWQDFWNAWDTWLQEARLTPVQACLGFALAHPEVDRVVVGADSRNHLTELLSSVKMGVVPMPPEELSSEDPELVDPSRWGAK